MEKQFTIIKVGYTAGVYGCSGEYFNCIINNNGGIFFQGMYGAEERIAQQLREKGYKEVYTQSVYGQLRRKDIAKNLFLSEHEAIEKIKTQY